MLKSDRAALRFLSPRVSEPLLVCRQSRRGLCEEALLKIRGVISFTFQMAVKRCVVRIRSDLKAEVRVQLQKTLRTKKKKTATKKIGLISLQSHQSLLLAFYTNTQNSCPAKLSKGDGYCQTVFVYLYISQYLWLPLSDMSIKLFELT